MPKQELLARALVPPQDVDVEMVVLGGIMNQRDAMAKVVPLITAEVFYKTAHQMIYEAMTALWQQGVPIDVITVADQMRKLGSIEAAGGAYYLTEITSRVASAANIEFHCRYLVEHAIRRRLIAYGQVVSNAATEPSKDVFDILSAAEAHLYRAMNLTGDKRGATADRMAALAAKRAEDVQAGRAPGRIPWGLDALDKATGGLGFSRYSLVAARPSVGKTAFGLSCALSQIELGIDVLWFALEQDEYDMGERLLSMQSSVGLTDIRVSKNLTAEQWSRLNAAQEWLRKYGPRFEARIASGLTPSRLRSEVAQWRKSRKSERAVVYVDYIGLMRPDAGDKWESGNDRMTRISAALASIGRDYECSLVVLSQLSREVMGSAPYIPVLKHLRDSGSLEQDSEQVVMLWRSHTPDWQIVENSYPELHFLPSTLADTTAVAFVRKGSMAGAAVELGYDFDATRFRESVKSFAPY